jgi:two-component system cell cycle sensor histidine kinase/response regulator CckA
MVFEHAPFGLALSSVAEGRYLAVNEAYCQLFGAPREQIVGRTSLELEVWKDPADRQRVVELLRRDGFVRDFPLEGRGLDGRPLCVLLSADLTQIDGFECIVSTLRDVTAQREAERALRESEERFSKAFRNSPDAICISRMRDGVFIDINEGFVRLTGYQRDEVIGVSSLQLNLWPEPRTRAEFIAAMQRDGVVREKEMPFRMRDGAMLDFTISAERVEIGGEACMIAIVRDVTARRRSEAALRASEAALRASEEKFAKAFQASPDAIVISAVADARILEVNEGFERITGYRRHEVIGRTVPELGLWRSQAVRDETLRRLQSEGRVRDVEAEFRAKDGSIIHGLLSSDRIELDGQPCLVAVVRNTTELRHATKALRLSEEMFRLTVEFTGQLVYDFDVRTGSIRWAGAIEKLTGYSFDEFQAVDIARWQELVHPDDRPVALAQLEAAQEACGKYSCRYRFQRKDGTWFSVEDEGAFQPGEDGRAVRMVGSMKDVTERGQLEEQVRQSQKLESVGRLAGGIAHDFNNILTVIQGHAGLLLQSPALPEDLRESVIQIAKSAEFAGGLTRQLLLVGRKQPMRMQVIDLNDTVARMSRLLRRLIGETIALEVDTVGAAAPVHADPGMVEQVLLNLVVNARDAMPGGGRVRLSTRPVEVRSAQASLAGSHRPGRYYAIEVHDTGTGIPADVLPKIFDPFFTTKPAGQGTGLGLATVYSIVQQHGGWIDVDSSPHRGTTFTVHFAAAPGAAVDEESGAPRRHVPRLSAMKVLVVEDEEPVRALLRRMFALDGHHTFVAANAEEALALWAVHRHEIDLVFSDITMPGLLDGRELVRRLRAERPDLPAILASGYNAELHEDPRPHDPRTHYLWKPFAVERLRETVAEALGVRSQ